MWQRFLAWLDNTPLTDPIQRSQARLFQTIVLLLLTGNVISFPLIASTTMAGQGKLMLYTASTLGMFFYALALVLMRRGRFAASVYVGLAGLVVLGVINALPGGVLRSPIMPIVFMLPIILAGGMIGWRGLAIISGSSLLAMIVVGFLEVLPTPLAGYGAPAQADPITVLPSVALLIIISTIFLGLLGGLLRRTMESAVVRQRELEMLRDSLEQTVTDRTASLEMAIREVERREAKLSTTLAELQDTRATVRELSAPVIPVLPGVLVTPLVGVMDAERMLDFADHLLHEVDRQRASHVVFDVTGMPMIDTQVAQTLLQTATSISLLGGASILVGVRPEVAQTLVALGTNLASMPTYPDLREAVMMLINQSLLRNGVVTPGRAVSTGVAARR